MTGPGDNLSIINSVVQFTNGSQAQWNSIAVPIPLGMVVYATDTTAIKKGDGVTLYANLPTLFSLSDIVNIMASLAGKAPLVHQHAMQDITDLVRPERFVFETFIGSDGLSIKLPWIINTPIDVDVFVNGVRQLTSSLSLVNQNVIQIATAVAPRTQVEVIWYVEANASHTIGEVSTLTIAADAFSTNPHTGVITITLANGTVITITGDLLFQGLPAITWTTGETIPSTDFAFINLSPANWLPGGLGINAGVCLIAGEPASTWLSGSSLAGNTIFISLGAGTWLTAGPGITSGDTLFDVYGYAKWDTGASDLGSGDTVFNSLTALAFA